MLMKLGNGVGTVYKLSAKSVIRISYAKQSDGRSMWKPASANGSQLPIGYAPTRQKVLKCLSSQQKSI